MSRYRVHPHVKCFPDCRLGNLAIMLWIQKIARDRCLHFEIAVSSTVRLQWYRSHEIKSTQQHKLQYKNPLEHQIQFVNLERRPYLIPNFQSAKNSQCTFFDAIGFEPSVSSNLVNLSFLDATLVAAVLQGMNWSHYLRYLRSR